jgi:hypothetical protein
MNRKPKLTLEQVRDICAKRGLVLLSKEYLRRSAHLHCRCRKCQHTWRPWFPNILRGSGCPMCARAKLATAKPKLSITEVRAHCRKVGLKCLARTYEGRHYPLHCRCTKCDHEWKPTFGKILMGRRCPKCADQKTSERQTIPIDKLINQLEDKTIELVCDSHWKGKIRFCDFRCKQCGYKWTTGVHSVISTGSGCRKCSRQRVAEKAKLPHKQVDARLLAKGAIRIGPFVATGKAMMVRFTKCGHELKMTLNSITKGRGCPRCNRHMKVSKEEYHIFAQSFGGEVITIASSVSRKSMWRCQLGHIFERPLAALRHLKRFCPYCTSSLGEASARYIAEAVVGQRFFKVRVPGLRGHGRYPLELDIYNPDLQLAIEHHGEQHYSPMKHWGGAEQLRKIKERDKQRRRGCKKLGIELIEVRSLREKTSVEDYINRLKEACFKRGIKISKAIDVRALDEKSLLQATPDRILLYNALRDKASSRGFSLLEKSYLGSRVYHRMRCPNGHKFEAIPNKFMSGRGCPKCPRVSPNRVSVIIDNVKIFPSIHAAAAHLGVHDSTLIDAMATTGRCHGHRVARLHTELRP